MRQVGELFIAEDAVITADVVLSRGVNICFGVVIRGDVARITLEENVNIQDNSVVHCDFGFPQVIEPHVVVGHAAVLHGVRVGMGSLIGIGAKLLGGSEIGEECIIGAGAVVPPGMKVPPRSVVMGLPGKVIRSARPEEIEQTRKISQRYQQLARQYAAGQVAWPVGRPRARPLIGDAE